MTDIAARPEPLDTIAEQAPPATSSAWV